MGFKLPDWLRYEIQQRWERLAINIRAWVNKNPRVVIGITAASVSILLIVVIVLLIPQETVKVEDYEKEWFYDVNTGKLFVAKKDLVPPVQSPWGPLADGRPAGVRAYVFSYKPDPNESERFIGFLEIPDPNAESAASGSDGPSKGARLWGEKRLIRRVEDEQWYPANSIEGRVILKELFLPNEDGQVAIYYPPE
jgi:hypothetical protein